MAGAWIYTFEAMTESLPYVPIAARRVLDALGRKLSLEGWASLDISDRWTIVRAGAAPDVQTDVAPVIDSAMPAPTRTEPTPDPDSASPPPELVAALGPHRALNAERWRRLRPLDRYALVKSMFKPAKLAAAYAEIAPQPSELPAAPAVGVMLSHLTGSGEAYMVDVGGKVATARRAVATARVRTTRAVVEEITSGTVGKGDVLAAARIAGILASKRTPELIPLCHPVQTTRAAIDFEPDAARGELRVMATVEAVDRTGVEMEAMVAASIASLTVYDMIKSADAWAVVDAVRLETKSGGKGGDKIRPPDPPVRGSR